MSKKNKKRNKVYQGARVLINPLDVLSNRSNEAIEQDTSKTLDTLFLISLDAMAKDGTNHEVSHELWSNLVCALNTSLVLCKAGFQAEMMRTVNAALTGLARVKTRADNGHGWQLGNHYDAVRAGLEVNRRHKAELPKHVMRRALHKVMLLTGNLEEAAKLEG